MRSRNTLNIFCCQTLSTEGWGGEERTVRVNNFLPPKFGARSVQFELLFLVIKAEIHSGGIVVIQHVGEGKHELGSGKTSASVVLADVIRKCSAHHARKRPVEVFTSWWAWHRRAEFSPFLLPEFALTSDRPNQGWIMQLLQLRSRIGHRQEQVSWQRIYVWCPRALCSQLLFIQEPQRQAAVRVRVRVRQLERSV